jgi:hypothetical protein
VVPLAKTNAQPVAPDALAYGSDAYDVNHFLSTLSDLVWRAKLDFASISSSVLGKLAGLARVANDDAFRAGAVFAIRTAIKEATLLSQPVYRHEFIKKFEDVGRAALHLQHLLNSLVDPQDHTSLWVGKGLGYSVCIVRDRSGKFNEDQMTRIRLQPLRAFFEEPIYTLVQASKSAGRWADLFGVKSKGKPRGVKGCGTALVRLIAHLEFAASTAGGALDFK